ncbi:hypothetical protein GCM10027610_115370 [Dactylosporangium cerinum]
MWLLGATPKFVSINGGPAAVNPANIFVAPHWHPKRSKHVLNGQATQVGEARPAPAWLAAAETAEAEPALVRGVPGRR